MYFTESYIDYLNFNQNYIKLEWFNRDNVACLHPASLGFTFAGHCFYASKYTTNSMLT